MANAYACGADNDECDNDVAVLDGDEGTLQKLYYTLYNYIYSVYFSLQLV